MIDQSDEERLLSRFRLWLEQARTMAETETGGRGSAPPGDDGDDRDVGLYRLVEEFTALRQELKLQTRSSRSLQEQTEALLPALRQAIEQFRAVEPRTAEAAWNAGKPLAEALADLDEALDRGRAEIQRAQFRLVEEPDRVLAEELDRLLARQSWLSRHWLRGYHEQVRATVAHEGSEKRRPFFDALVEGYQLIQTRLQRAMNAEEIERIACLGRPVDPERMIVLEVVDDPTKTPGEVVEEVRRGYTWRGRLLRYAEVRAARTPVPQASAAIAPADQAPEPEPDH